VIEDEEFWTRYGGHYRRQLGESTDLRLYSSLDRDLIVELATDDRWSNEGLFALLQRASSA